MYSENDGQGAVCANPGLRVGQCRGESRKLYHATRQTRGEETVQTPLVVRVQSRREVATREHGFSEIWLDVPVDISGKSRFCVEARNHRIVRDSSPRRCVEVISTAGLKRIILLVSSPVLVEHAHLSRHKGVLNPGTSESTSQRNKIHQLCWRKWM